MKWIPVTEKLPLKQEDVKNYDSVEVIVVNRNGEVFVTDFAMGNTLEPWHSFGDARDGWITHWMPLPEPPEETP